MMTEIMSDSVTVTVSFFIYLYFLKMVCVALGLGSFELVEELEICSSSKKRVANTRSRAKGGGQ